MISRARLIVLVFAICLHAIPAMASEEAKRVPVTIVVVDITGAAIPRAAVEINPSNKVSTNNLKTDGAGRASLQLSPGKYELIVTAQAFAPSKRQIDVSTEAMTIEVKLRVCSGCGPDCSGPCVEVEPEAGRNVETQAPPIETTISPPAPTAPNTSQTPLTIAVTDPSGAVVPGATVTLHSIETMCEETIVTSSYGRATTRARAGDYELLVQREGFVEAKQTSEVHAEVQTINVVIHGASDYSGPEVVAEDPPPALNLKMLVVDKTGVAVPRAWIRLHAVGYIETLEMRTDADGHASVKVPRAKYDLVVIASGFKRDKRQIDVHSEQELKITLDSDGCASVFPNSARQPR